MKRHLSIALAGAALAASFAATPAQANHTLCDNEDGNIWAGVQNGIGVGVDPTYLHVCVFHGLTGEGYVHLVIRPNGPQSVCTYYTPTDPSDDACFYVPDPVAVP